MTSSTPQAAPNAAESLAGSRVLRWTLIATIVLYAGLFVSGFVPFLNIVLLISIFLIWYLWGYIGVPVAVIVLFVGWLVGRYIFERRRQRLQLAVQISAIAFALVGILLIADVQLGSGRAIWMGGYWVHVKLCLDPESVRQWVQTINVPDDTDSGTGFGVRIAREQWPAHLRRMGHHMGVFVRREPREVTIMRGGHLTGYWGVHIAAKGADWAGQGEDCWVKRLEDGAWIWNTPN